jgi:hypothetical protein
VSPRARVEERSDETRARAALSGVERSEKEVPERSEKEVFRAKREESVFRAQRETSVSSSAASISPSAS